MRKLILAICLLILPVALHAQENTPQLDKFMAMKTFEADFTQENYYPGIDKFSHKGKVYVERGYKALWDYADEFYLLESGSILHYSAEMKQAMKIAVDMEKTDDPATMLLGLLLRNTSIKDAFEVVESDSLIVLMPKTNMGIKSVELGLKNGKLESLRSIDASGGSISIQFTNIKQDGKINRKVFEKTLPEGTEIFGG